MFKKLSVILIFGSFFAYSRVLVKEPFEFYLAYVIFLLYFPIFFAKFGVPKWPVFIFLPLFISGVIYCQMDLNTPQQFYKIFFGFFGSCLFYHYVVEAFDFDVRQLIRYYIKAAFIVAAIGIFQMISYKVGFRYGYHYHWFLNKWSISFGGFVGMRLSSIFSEPAYFAATIAPAFFISLYNITTRYPLYITKVQSAVIIAAYVLTASSVGFIGIFIGIVLLLLNFGIGRYAVIIIPALVFLTSFAYQNVPDFRDRWDSTIAIYTTEDIYTYDIHGSSFVLYNNNHIAWQNFIRNPLFGTGLGSHPTAFDKYSLTLVEDAVQIDFNKMDANSMFLRLMSETGLYGMVLIILLLVRCWVFRQTTTSRELWVISGASGLIIILYLLRQGHYFINGFPFFIWIFYYTAVENWDRRANPENYPEEEETGQEIPAIDAPAPQS